MNRDTFSLSMFNRGVIRNADSRDIPLEAAIYNNNIDGSLNDGKLIGIPVEASFGSNPPDAKYGGFFKRADGAYDFVYTTGDTSNTIKVVNDFYSMKGSPSVTTIHTGSEGRSFAPGNHTMHVGRRTDSSAIDPNPAVPYWVGRITHNQFGTLNNAGNISGASAECVGPRRNSEVVTIGTYNAADGHNWGDVQRVWYRLTFVYDGVQESPFSDHQMMSGSFDLSIPGIEVNGSESSPITYIPVTVTISHTSLNPRITGVNLYRAVDTGDGRGSFQLVSSKSVSESGWTTGGGQSYYVFNDYHNVFGPTFEANSGLLEDMTTSIVKYELNAVSSGYLFAGVCGHDKIPDALYIIFRSRFARYDTFNWATDFLKLDSIPTAMHAYEGRIIVSSENKTYIINAESFHIEATFDNIGCLGQRSMTATPFGVFWCDKNNAYHFNGSQVKIISEVFKSTAAGSDWHGFTYLYNPKTYGARYTPHVVYHSKTNYILFGIPSSSGTVMNVAAYNVSRERWDIWESFCTTGSSGSIFAGIFGEVFASTMSACVNTMGGTNRRSWNFKSKKIDMNSPGVMKKFYYLFIKGSGTISTVYNTDGITSGWAYPSSNKIVTTGGAWRRSTQISFQISGSTNAELETLSFQYRVLKGERNYVNDTPEVGIEI